MATGRVHDRLTYSVLLLIMTVAVYEALFQPVWEVSAIDILWLGAGFWFGGIYLNPDLDTRSRPYYRWGWLRWVWIPYQWMVPHRSSLSHGVWTGAAFRVIYLTAVLVVVYALVAWVIHGLTGVQWIAVSDIGEMAWSRIKRFQWEFLLILAGIWSGSWLHIIVDWWSSRGKFTKGAGRGSSKWGK